jgi:hypothetical protein
MENKYITLGYINLDNNLEEIVTDTIDSIDKLTEEYSRDKFISFLEIDETKMKSNFLLTDGKETHRVFFIDDVKNFKELLKKSIEEISVIEKTKNDLFSLIDKANNMELRKMLKVYNTELKRANKENYEKLKI